MLTCALTFVSSRRARASRDASHVTRMSGRTRGSSRHTPAVSSVRAQPAHAVPVGYGYVSPLFVPIAAAAADTQRTIRFAFLRRRNVTRGGGATIRSSSRILASISRRRFAVADHRRDVRPTWRSVAECQLGARSFVFSLSLSLFLIIMLSSSLCSLLLLLYRACLGRSEGTRGCSPGTSGCEM